MTSMLKRVDTAVFNFVNDFGQDKFTAGKTIFDLKADGVGYSTSGGFVDDIKAKLEDYKAKIIAGTITVPTAPSLTVGATIALRPDDGGGPGPKLA